MVKPHGQINRSTTPQQAVYGPLGEPAITIVAWCPDDEAKAPPEQVHLIHVIPGLEKYPLIMRFKSPDTLGFLIEELTRYRREVWSKCEPVKGEADKQVMAGLFDLLEEYHGLIDHLLDSDPITGDDLESDIREAQKRNGLKIEGLKRNAQLNGWLKENDDDSTI